MRSRPQILILALLLVPAVGAQVPAAPTSCDIALEAPATPPPVQPGATATIQVTVSNLGSLPARVGVTVSPRGAGWEMGETPPQQEIASGSTGTFAFTATANQGAQSQLILNFAAQGNCTIPGSGGSSCATLPGCTDNANTSGVVELAQAEGFRLPGLDSISLSMEWLIAGIAFVAVATAIPFLMKRKKRAIHAQCPEPLKMVRAGRGTSFPIELRNPGAAPLTTAFEVSPVPEGWSAFMPLPEVQLAAHEARSLWLMVRAPQTANVGETVDVELRLKTTSQPDAAVRVRAEVQGGTE